jgi:ssDNA-binding replication factor A large subunit
VDPAVFVNHDARVGEVGQRGPDRELKERVAMYGRVRHVRDQKLEVGVLVGLVHGGLRARGRPDATDEA